MSEGKGIKAGRVNKNDGETLHGYLVWCQGCKQPHIYDSRWPLRGTQGCPTFRPSYRTSKPDQGFLCHSFVTDGQIKFLDDCTHELAGQTLPLEDAKWCEEE